MMTYLYRMFCTVGLLAWLTMFVTSCSSGHGVLTRVHAPTNQADELRSNFVSQPTTTAAPNKTKRRIAQQDFGREAVFVACRSSDCPAVTPKTWAEPTPESIQPQDSLARGEEIQAGLSSDVVLSAVRPSRALHDGNTSDPLTNQLPTSIARDEDMTGKRTDSSQRSVQASTEAPPSKLLMVHFALGDDTLSDKAKRQIGQGIDSVSTLSPIHLVAINGRTDNVGSQSLNESLAWSRAKAVKDHLLSKYPELATLVNVQAQGKCCFRASNQTEQGRAMNRRVEMFIEALPIDP
jgi:outer membrane protein OmpA-like peptidoglycan-associated protein